MHLRIQSLLIVALLFFGCHSENEDTPAISETLQYSQVDTLVTSDSLLPASPGDLVLIRGTRLYALDFGIAKIHELSPRGEVINTFGRKGSGPGELDRTSRFAKNRDHLVVHHTARSSLSHFSPDGELMGTTSIDKPYTGSANISVYRDRILMGAVEREDGIVALSSLKQQSDPVMLGDSTSGSVDAEAYDRAIKQRKVPAAYRDDVITLFDDEGNPYLVYQAQTRVQKYHPSGKLAWDKTIPYPHKEALFDAFIEANSNTSGGFQPISPLRYFTDANHYGDRLFLLVSYDDDNQAHTFVLTVDDETGEVQERLTFPALDFITNSLVYSLETDAFYFVDRRTGLIIRAGRDS